MDDQLLQYEDRLAAVTVCSALATNRASRNGALPLAPREWNTLAQWLFDHQLQPASLLDPHEKVESRLEIDLPQLAEKLDGVRNRATTVAMELEQMEHRGIWALARFEEDYPSRWKEILKGSAPPILFGVGPPRLLNQRALAIVGSRDIDMSLMELAETLGRSIAKTSAVMISGGARGSDRMGMTGAINYGGEVVGVLSGDLDRLSRQREIRHWIDAEQLCLICHAHPGAGFSTGNAMARNKLIYTMADATIVIATTEGKGGTWSGATETLKKRWAPLLVWTGPGAPTANQALVELGGFPFDVAPESGDEMAQLVETAKTHWRNWDSPDVDSGPRQQSFLS